MVVAVVDCSEVVESILAAAGRVWSPVSPGLSGGGTATRQLEKVPRSNAATISAIDCTAAMVSALGLPWSLSPITVSKAHVQLRGDREWRGALLRGGPSRRAATRTAHSEAELVAAARGHAARSRSRGRRAGCGRCAACRRGCDAPAKTYLMPSCAAG